MDPIVLALIIGGGLLLASKKPKKKRAAWAPGDYAVRVGEERALQLPRDSGYWHETPIAPASADVDVYASKGDPLNLARIRGKSPGAVKVQFYADPDRTDLVAEYMFQVTE